MLERGPRGSSHISCQVIQRGSYSKKPAVVSFEARITHCRCRKNSRRLIWTPAPYKSIAVHDAATLRVPPASCCIVAASTGLQPSRNGVHLLAALAQPGTCVLCKSSWGKQQTSSVIPCALPDAFPEGAGSQSSADETLEFPKQQQIQQKQGAKQCVPQQKNNSQPTASSSSKPCRRQYAGKRNKKTANHSLEQQRHEPKAPPPQQQQQQVGAQTTNQQEQPAGTPVYGQFRQQLKRLVQQQQAQLSQGPTSYAGLRAAASGSTALLLSLLNSQLPLLLGSSLSLNVGGTNNASDHGSCMLTVRQQRALLREALVCISWHCSTHRLLPAEAQQLQELLLGQLLPALRPHLHTTNPKVLARVLFALGRCWASGWQSDDLVITSSEQQQQWQHHQDQYSSSSSTQQQHISDQQDKPEQQQQQQQEGVVLQRQHNQQQCQPQRQHIQQQCPGSSAEWVQHLMPLLPPSQLSAGALLATVEGCALHEVKPPPAWLAEASLAAYSMLESSKFDYNDAAALLQAYAQLEYSPPVWLMRSLVWRLQQWIPFLNPADLAGVLAGLQVLGFRPGNTWLRVWCESSSRLLMGMNSGQLAAAAGALAWAGYSPVPWWGRRLWDATGPLLPVAAVDELLLLLDSVLALRLSAPLGWVHAVYCSLRAAKRSLTLSQVADAAHVLAHMQLPASLYRHHRVWLAGCLKSSQVQDVAGLCRSELLYLLYAAGKLKVNPGRAWLAAALQRLHGQLDGASPAELVGSFMVFCGFRSHLPLQMAQGEAGVWLRDCLAAVAACVGQFSDEGLLQLLLACVDAGLGTQQPQERQQQQQVTPSSRQQMLQQQQDRPMAGAADSLNYVQLLADTLVMRLPHMSLLQLSMVNKILEGKVMSSSSGARGGSRTSSSSAEWFATLLQKCKTALAAMA